MKNWLVLAWVWTKLARITHQLVSYSNWTFRAPKSLGCFTPLVHCLPSSTTTLSGLLKQLWAQRKASFDFWTTAWASRLSVTRLSPSCLSLCWIEWCRTYYSKFEMFGGRCIGRPLPTHSLLTPGASAQLELKVLLNGCSTLCRIHSPWQ